MSRPWKVGLALAGTGFVLFIAASIFAALEVSRHASDWALDYLSHRYNSAVELGTLQISIYPRVQVTGENLALHFQGRSDLPPLIAAKRFVVQADPLELLRNPRRVRMVRLEGLQINVPPRQASSPASTQVNWKNTVKGIRSISFGQILSENAVLTILTAKPGRQPLAFYIEHLALHSTDEDGQLVFRATLTNAMPPGEIVSTGTFGPWVAEAPSVTPVSGDYAFKRADLGIFQGIAGILSAQGDYRGVLERIETDGTTDTPDFRVTRAGHPVDLKTTYHAIVDGTDGDTYLEPVVTQFLNTTLVARGKVEGTKGLPGKTITLDVTADQTRIEDLLRLTVDQPSALTGPVQLKTKFILPSGKQDILDRLALQGEFTLVSAHFTNGSLQQKFDNFSQHSLGHAHDLPSPNMPDSWDDVASDMSSNLGLKSGVLTLSGLAFQVPGADINLNGTYQLDQEMLDLHGHLSMKARLSQTTTGVKSFFLKAIDPFFSKNGKGTVLPIKIVGSVKQPSYGLDFHHKESASLSAE